LAIRFIATPKTGWRLFSGLAEWDFLLPVVAAAKIGIDPVVMLLSYEMSVPETIQETYPMVNYCFFIIYPGRAPQIAFVAN
jgi:hypothetical protein